MNTTTVARLFMAAVVLFALAAAPVARAAFISPVFISWGFDGSSSAGYAPGSDIIPSFNIGGTRTNATQTQTLGVDVYISKIEGNYSPPAVQMGTITATLPGNSTSGPIARATYDVPTTYGGQPIQRGDYYMILVAEGSSATAVKSMKFTVIIPDISVEQPSGTPREDANSTVSFPSVAVFDESTRVFTVRNPGNTTLTVNTVSFSGANASSFQMQGSPPFTVSGGGGTANFTVRFTPQVAGNLTAVMSIGSSVTGSKNPYTVTLTGTAVPAPAVTTLAATEIGLTTAKLNAEVNANGASTTPVFQYGLNTSYGTTANGVPAPVTGNGLQAVSVTLLGLQPATTYHFRARGTSAGGTVNGSDFSFTTLSVRQDWHKIHFGDTGGGATGGPDQDPNGNGIPNSIEYALGGNPVDGTTGIAILPVLGRDPGDGRMTYSFRRYPARTDVTLKVVVASSPAGPWADAATSSGGAAFTGSLAGVVVSETGSGDFRDVKVKLPPDALQRRFRQA